MQPAPTKKVPPYIRVIVGWLVGNILWGVVVFSVARIAEEAAMIEAIGAVGFLVLIVVGLVYLMFREKQSPNAAMQNEPYTRFVVMVMIALQYNVKPGDLSDLNNPQAMEERAKRLQVERGLGVSQPQPSPSPSNADMASSRKQ